MRRPQKTCAICEAGVRVVDYKDERTLTRYLRAPAEVVPGTKMIFFGLKKDQEISDVIAYLKQFAGDGKQVSR